MVQHDSEASTPSGAPEAPWAVAVAYSGGRDSTALLHATATVASRAGGHVFALHVHHGLQAAADDWVRHGERFCASLNSQGCEVTFACRRVRVDPADEGLEAAARRARYAALARMAREAGCELVLLAHHREDQAETVLLQALRGAGMAGLAAMPARISRDGIVWVRPWLQRPRADIEAYVAAHALPHVDDASNADPRHARNRLRLEAWPALAALAGGFPAAARSLGQVARHAQEADACLADLARLDLGAAVDAPQLELVLLDALAPHRRANALRHWLGQRLGRPPRAVALQRLLDRPWPASARWSLGQGAWVTVHRGRLGVDFRTAAAPTAHAPSAATVHQGAAPVGAGAPPQVVDLSTPGRHELPGWAGHVEVELASPDAVALPLALLARVAVRPRSGGERFSLGPGRPARPLKKQYQALGVPAWQREGPLLWLGQDLVFVPGLGMQVPPAARGAAGPLAQLRWHPHAGDADECTDAPAAPHAGP